MKMCKVVLPGAAAAALLATAALLGPAAPAHAAGVKADLELEDFPGARMSTEVPDKTVYAHIRNNGPGTPRSLTVTLDTRHTPGARLALITTAFEGCVPDSGVTTCQVPPDRIPGPGETLDFPIDLLLMDLNPDPPVFTLEATLRIASPDDTTPNNNQQQVGCEFAPVHGPDLGVLAPDVKRQLDAATDPDDAEARPLLVPGAETLVVATLVNQGQGVAEGIRFQVALPEGVTFTDELPDCAYSDDRRNADCESNLLVGPWERARASFPVRVAADVRAPASLVGGSVVVTPLVRTAATTERTTADKSTGTSFLRKLAGTEPQEDVDAADNRDEFAVIVSAVRKPTPGAPGNGGPGNGGSGNGGNGSGGGSGGGAGSNDGGLPVTGAPVALLGGVGVAAFVLGGLMLLSARGRRGAGSPTRSR
ncbi:hypothetical protein ABZV78_12900 [Micromonospora sp. NPDC004540]|uniref:hypothetical protein n=1 Tax=Micromonospora sp. NPDC004540 TaxID=3154457 RepID=UPI0033B63F27